jgi:hypothetical protein
MPVKNLNLSQLKPAEIAEFADDLCLTLDGTTELDPFIVTSSGQIRSQLALFQDRNGQIVKNILNGPVFEADLERDKIYKKTTKYIRGLANHPFDTTIEAAGEKIYSVFEAHNLTLYKESYSVESQHIKALLIDLDKPENAEAITLLNLKPALDQLKAAQQKFDQLFVDKNKVESELTVTQISEFINPLRAMIYEMLAVLNSAERSDASKYAAIVAHINELIAASNARAQARKTRKETAAELANKPVTPQPVIAQ